MSFEDDGYLLTDTRSPTDGGDSIEWSTETDWENARETEDVEIVGDSVRLASASTVIDDFEWGGPYTDRWALLSNGYSGNISIDITQDGEILEGDYSIVLDRPTEPHTGNAMIGSYPGSSNHAEDLDYYPQPGDTITWLVRNDSSGDSANRLGFGWTGDWSSRHPSNLVSVSISNQEFRLWIDHDIKALDNVNLSQDTNYWVEVVWGTDGTIDGTLYTTARNADGELGRDSQIASWTHSSTKYTDSGVLLGAGTDQTTTRYDNIRII